MIVKKYKAEYANEVMETIPHGYIDKTICGCGLTTVALENNMKYNYCSAINIFNK